MSMTHTVHKEILIHGLADECDRCRIHADDPFHSLDNGILRDLLTRIINGEQPRSENEGVAMANIRITLDRACYLAALNPIQFAKYAKTKHDVHLIAVVK